MKKIKQLCLLALSLQAPLLVGVEKEASLTKSDLQFTVESLRNIEDLEDSFLTLSNLEEKQLKQLRLNKVLMSLVKNENLTKRERIATYEFIAETAITNEIIDEEKYYEILLDNISKTNSPLILKISIEHLLEAESFTNARLKVKLEKLVSNIIEDASEEKSKQKFQESLHVQCLKTITSATINKDIEKGLLSMLKEINKHSPKMRLAVFTAIANVLNHSNSKAFKEKSDRLKILKGIEEYIKTSPAALPLGTVSGIEIQCLSKSLTPLKTLITQKELSSSIKEVIKKVEKFLTHKDLSIVSQSLEILTALSTVESKKEQYYLHEELKTILSVKNSKMKPEIQARYNKTFSKLLSIIIQRDQKKELSKIYEITDHLYKVSKEHANFELVRDSALKALLVFDPSFFERKIGKDLKKLFNNLIKDCIEVFKNEEFKKAYPNFVKGLSNVLFEITGKDYGLEPALWFEWSKKNASKYFKS